MTNELLAAIQTRYPDALEDQYEIRDDGDGPYFSRWQVRHEGLYTPKPTYEEVLEWMDDLDSQETTYAETIGAAVNLYEGQKVANISEGGSQILLEGVLDAIGALDADGNIKRREVWGTNVVNDEEPLPGEPASDDPGPLGPPPGL